MPLFSRSKKAKAKVVSNGSANGEGMVASTDVAAAAHPASNDVSMKPTMRYQTLDADKMELRLLQVSPGQGSQPIECVILYTALRLKPYHKYETISYCWGSSVSTTPIEVDGQSVEIYTTAADAIRRVRSPIYPRVIWIDQLCINQGDNTERGQQVANMHNVYRCARQNLIWLGDDNGTAIAVKTTIDSVLSNIRQETRNYTKLFDMTHRDGQSSRCRRNGNLLDPRIDVRPLRALFSSAWFGRLWIVQEVAMGRWNICHFGGADILLRDVLRVGVWLLYNTSILPDDMVGMTALEQALSLWYLTDELVPDQLYRNTTQSLQRTRRLLQNFDCSVEHDNVFALLGLSRIGGPLYGKTLAAITPDYHKSVDMVFRDATRAIIEDSGTVDVLQGRLLNMRMQQRSMPSWVIDFHDRPHNTAGPSALGQHFCADDGVMSNPDDWQGDPSILQVEGILVDTVMERTGPLLSTTDRALSFFLAETLELTWSVTSGTSRQHGLEMCNTLAGGSNWLRQPLNTADFKDWGNWIEHLNAVLGSGCGTANQQAIHFAKAVLRACYRRRFFTTRDGRLGIGPSEMVEGDLIVVLYGGSIPFVLRRLRNGQSILVGGGYVYGIMVGEAVRQHRVGGRRSEMFQLV